MEDFDLFLAKTMSALKHPQERKRALVLLTHWTTVWPGPKRSITYAFSNHGAFVHFNQMIGNVWSNVFAFHAAHRHGLSLRGPDTDRARKAHRDRDRPLDRKGLDEVFAAWSIRPEAHPAGNAVEFFLDETPDEVWAEILQEVMRLS